MRPSNYSTAQSRNYLSRFFAFITPSPKCAPVPTPMARFHIGEVQINAIWRDEGGGHGLEAHGGPEVNVKGPVVDDHLDSLTEIERRELPAADRQIGRVSGRGFAPWILRIRVVLLKQLRDGVWVSGKHSKNYVLVPCPSHAGALRLDARARKILSGTDKKEVDVGCLWVRRRIEIG